jgi:hypothetical protein
MALTKLNNLLKDRMKESGFKKQADALEIIAAVTDFINTKFSPALAQRVKPAYFKDGVMAFSSTSAPAASELKMHENEIIKYLNKKLGKPDILRKIRILL